MSPENVNATPPSPISTQIQSLEGHPSWADAAHPEHSATINKLRELYAAADREDRGEPPTPEPDEDAELEAWTAERSAELPHIDVLRRQAGINLPVLPESIKATWVESAESDFLSWAMDEGLSKASIQRVLDDYVNWLVIEGRSETGLRPGDEEIWQGRLTQAGLTDTQARRLIAWHRENSQ